MTVVVLQAAYGNYDVPASWPDQTVAYRRVIVTDDLAWIAQHAPLLAGSDGFSIIQERRPHMHPRMAAKTAKCLPHAYAEEDGDVVIWCDASIEATDEFWVEYLLDSAPSDEPAWFAHPLRTTVAAEVPASTWMAKYQGQEIYAQYQHYVSRGFPDNVGLFASGICVMRDPMTFTRAFGTRWLQEQVRWSYQDQISLPYLLWHYGIQPQVIPGSLFPPPHAVIRNHASEL